MIAGGRPLFIAFYSFRGGVGRTMALASVGMQLGGLGRRVLLIDFDLEAPGLTVLARGLRARPRGEADGEPPGVTDIIQDCLKAPHRSPLRVGASPQSLTRKYAFRLKIPPELVRIKGGRVDAIPCGRTSEGYRERLHTLDLPALYADGVGAPMMARLKEQIRGCGFYDYVLIDSRTGWSDEGGIVTTHLADHVILFSGLNHQNVEGTADFLRDVEASKRGENWVSLVFSPVPQAYEELRDQRARDATKLIRDRASVNLEPICFIPYHPRIALDDTAFLSTWMSTGLRPAYERIASRVRELASDTPVSALQAAARALSEGRVDEAESQLERVRDEDPSATGPVLPTTGLLWYQSGRLAHDRGDLDAAERRYRRSLGIMDELGDERAAAASSHALGVLAQDRGGFEVAEEWYRRSLASEEAVGNRAGAATTLYQLGTLAHARGEFDAAEGWYGQSVAALEELGDRPARAAPYHQLGILAQSRGELDAAKEWYLKSLAITEEVGDRGTAAKTYHQLGALAENRGDPGAAEEWYRRSLAAADEVNDETGIEENSKALEELGMARRRAKRVK